MQSRQFLLSPYTNYHRINCGPMNALFIFVECESRSVASLINFTVHMCTGSDGAQART